MIKLHTSHGEITIDLNNEKAPITTQNFIDYVNSGHFDNTIFHRVINDFMIQGGGFESGMSQKEARASIKNEAANGLKNDAYTVAMARTSDVNGAYIRCSFSFSTIFYKCS
jgi:peptidyl-prolyl cis-trans isomerase B (cyclophilin B)